MPGWEWEQLINYKRGMRRLWLVLSLVGIIFRFWYLSERECLFGCSAKGMTFYWPSVPVAFLQIISVPLGLLVLGYVGRWVIRGFAPAE
jgi:hypothetical protein